MPLKNRAKTRPKELTAPLGPLNILIMKRIYLAITFLLILFLAIPFQAQAASKSSKKSASTKSSKKSTSSKKSVKHKAASKKASAPQAEPTPKGPTMSEVITAYKYAYALYADHRFDKAKEIFKKLAILPSRSDINANSLFLYSQCAFRTEDYIGCVKALTVLAKRFPASTPVTKGYVKRFCIPLIDDVATLQTHWDYYRFQGNFDENGNPVWLESVPMGAYKIKRINFKLGFGLFRVLSILQPNASETVSARQKLDSMLNAPITMLWVDEKAPRNKWGHPEDFLSIFSENEKKYFSKVICQRIFFDWETDKFYRFVNMYDDVRNLRPRFVARTKLPDEGNSEPPASPPVPGVPSPVNTNTTPIIDPYATLTLSKLFLLAGYNPYTDTYTNTIESSPVDLSL